MTDSPDGGPISPLEESGRLQLPYVGTDGPNLVMATQMAASNSNPDTKRRLEIVRAGTDEPPR